MNKIKYRSSNVWFNTNLPLEICNSIENDLLFFDKEFKDSKIKNENFNNLNKKIRNSKNTWIPTTHWTHGFIWPYICRANEECFKYDITNIDNESMQYTSYCEGQYYQWHSDDDYGSHVASIRPNSSNTFEKTVDDYYNYLQIKTEHVRKLSFSLLLSDADDYEGGNFQILNGKDSYFAPRQRGTLIIFDSRMLHRVLKVTKGQRKSLVGWCIGPRWK